MFSKKPQEKNTLKNIKRWEDLELVDFGNNTDSEQGNGKKVSKTIAIFGVNLLVNWITTGTGNFWISLKSAMITPIIMEQPWSSNLAELRGSCFMAKHQSNQLNDNPCAARILIQFSNKISLKLFK